MKTPVKTYDQIYTDVWDLRTKSANIISDLKDILSNLSAIDKNIGENTSIPFAVKENYFRIISEYVTAVKDLRQNSELSRFTRVPYDKAIGVFYSIVYDPEYNTDLMSGILEPLRDVMAMHSHKKVPIEFMMVIMYFIEKLDLNIKDYLHYQQLFSLGDVSEEDSNKSDEITDQRIELLEAIILVADTFFDLRIYKLV